MQPITPLDAAVTDTDVFIKDTNTSVNVRKLSERNFVRFRYKRRACTVTSRTLLLLLLLLEPSSFFCSQLSADLTESDHVAAVDDDFHAATGLSFFSHPGDVAEAKVESHGVTFVGTREESHALLVVSNDRDWAIVFPGVDRSYSEGDNRKIFVDHFLLDVGDDGADKSSVVAGHDSGSGCTRGREVLRESRSPP